MQEFHFLEALLASEGQGKLLTKEIVLLLVEDDDNATCNSKLSQLFSNTPPGGQERLCIHSRFEPVSPCSQ